MRATDIDAAFAHGRGQYWLWPSGIKKHKVSLRIGMGQFKFA
jgi:hypothetical protein